jgi:hypothetical protein
MNSIINCDVTLPQGKLGLELEPESVIKSVPYGLRIRSWEICEDEM